MTKGFFVYILFKKTLTKTLSTLSKPQIPGNMYHQLPIFKIKNIHKTTKSSKIEVASLKARKAAVTRKLRHYILGYCLRLQEPSKFFQLLPCDVVAMGVKDSLSSYIFINNFKGQKGHFWNFCIAGKKFKQRIQRLSNKIVTIIACLFWRSCHVEDDLQGQQRPPF